MNSVAHIQNPPAWPTTPGISHTDRPAPLLLEELLFIHISGNAY